MNCEDPFVKDGRAFGCTQCLPCRINRRRIWTHRIILEAKEHVNNAFITLTYSDDNLPRDGSVCSVVLQKYLKRLRKAYSPGTFRFYACGEYGEELLRPHYHAALFGFPSCINGQTQYNQRGFCCEVCHMVSDAWGLGHIYVGSLTAESSAYIAGYVTKKYVLPPDGLRPPFSRMSNRPGIGAGVMDDVASALLMEDYKGPDVPTSLIHGGKSLPLGRYLTRRLRTRIGRSPDAPQETLDKMGEALRELREKAHSYAPVGHKTFAFKQEVISAGEGRRQKQRFWQRVRDQKRNIV